ncbi:MAG TPA: TlpA disulfide reductase family protein [Gemmataceae bacterium]|nr:TlpA disulfide reductase family protein [Gemmataceae bacterium]
MRREGLAIIVAACLAIAGCSLFGKKKPDAEQPPPQMPPPTAANNTPAGNGKGSAFSTTSNPKSPLPGASGMLAGKVICNYDRQPPPTVIQVVATGEKSEAKGQEIATDSQGYFTIQGLVPGQGYQLTARTRDGDVKMGGVTFAIAPNPRVLIVISEDFSGPAAPKKTNDKSTGANDTRNGDLPNRPVGVPNSTGSTAEISPVGGESAANGGGSDFAARDQSERERIPLSIGAGGRGPPQPTPNEYGGTTSVAARVPSCVMAGRQLDNFALYDLTGLPWEYRNHRGKLVLIDFWGTWCPPCMKSLPHIKALHETYAKYGLEVVGIAYEKPAPAVEQARAVQAVRDRLQLPYRILLGDLYTCPVKTKFKVEAFPSLFLLDENNRIIWWKDHYLSEAEKQDLDQLIRQHLK